MRIRRQEQSLRTIRHEVLNQIVSEATDEEFAAVVEELAVTGGREQYLLGRAKADIVAAMRGHVSLWRNSCFEPALLEVTFGIRGGLPALEIDTPKGRRAILRGKIDRIDIADFRGQQLIAVIDYKRSSRYKFRLESAMAGLQVQLIAYLKAAAMASAAGKIGGGAAAPAGMYYFNILPEWEKVGPSELLDGPKAPEGKQWQLKGFTNADWLGAFRNDSEGDSEGQWPMEIRLTNKGEPYANTPAARTEDFGRFVDGVWAELGKTVDNILDGQFDIRPYRMGQEIACTYCVYDDVCRFAPEFNRYREIERCGSVRQLLARIAKGSGE
jgi:ATP-dependent helicase/nuclease subunit B